MQSQYVIIVLHCKALYKYICFLCFCFVLFFVVVVFFFHDFKMLIKS